MESTILFSLHRIGLEFYMSCKLSFTYHPVNILRIVGIARFCDIQVSFNPPEYTYGDGYIHGINKTMH